MSHRELLIPLRPKGKARPRFDPRSGRAYHDKAYRDWLDSAAEIVALTLRKPMMDGPLIVRTAMSPAGIEVAILESSPVEWSGRRPDVDNAAGAVLDALQKGGAIRNDRDVVRLEAWYL